MTLLENMKTVPETLTQKKLLLINDYDKLTTVENLVTYLNQYLPNPTEEQKETLLSLLRSTDAESVELGINMCRLFNMTDILFDIYLSLSNLDNRHNGSCSAELVNRSNVRWKYLTYFTKFELKHFRNFTSYGYSHEIIDSLIQLYENNMLSINQKRKFWLYVYHISSDWSYRQNHTLQQTLDLPDIEKQQLQARFIHSRYDCLPERYSDIS